MTKTLKNILMLFTLICAIFLVVFCVELILVNRDNDATVGSAISDARTTENDETDTELSEDDPENNGEEDFGWEQFNETIVPREQVTLSTGQRFALPMLEEQQTLIIFVDEYNFNYFEEEIGWWFEYTGEGNASLEITFDLISPPGGINVLAERVLYGYLDGGNSTVLGERRIGESELRGVHAVGENEGITHEAWVHSITGSNDEGLALVFIISYQNDEQRAALNEILDTMTMTDD